MIPHVFADAPSRVYWELTRACDLACRHCRAEAQPERATDELDTEECVRVLDDLADVNPRPHVVLTGGDPLKRPDLLELVSYGTAIGLDVALAPSATPALSGAVARSLAGAGVGAMSLSLDGNAPAQHDGMRGVVGCFEWTLAAAEQVIDAGIPLQINTLVTEQNQEMLGEMAMLVARLGAARWSLFFPVRVGRAVTLDMLRPLEGELILTWLASHAEAWPFAVSTTEAPQYRRILMHTLCARGVGTPEILKMPAARSFGIRDGNGIMFIGASGDVAPSGFLPVVAGNVRRANPLTIYREAPVFRILREPDGFHGRCGRCPFRAVCGGSRARAYAATGDLLGEDPLCAYEPRAAA